jgi:hypothetical protein
MRTLATVFATVVLGIGSAYASKRVAADETPTLAQIQELAKSGFIYGYPLVLVDLTREVTTAVPKVTESKAPLNQLVRLRAFPTPEFTDVVSPNVDTLYTSGFVDLTDEPMVLSVPDTGGRYYVFECMSAWSNVFASLGSRTTGTAAGHYAFTAPGWSGDLPKGVVEIKSPTALAWLLGRVQTNGVADYPTVHAIQDGFKLTPLSAFGTDYEPPEDVPVDDAVDLENSPQDQAWALDATEFFSRLARLLERNPPDEADQEMVAKLAKLGVVPGKPFDPEALGEGALDALDVGLKKAHAIIEAEVRSQPRAAKINGWMVNYDLGDYGTDYLFRSAVAFAGLGANLAKDAIYPMTFTDDHDELLTGANGNRYVLHFEPDQLPPVHAFWSVTLYDQKQFLVENPLGRYALGDRNDLKFNEDGSLDVLIQHESPGADRENNWLPAPDGPFNLIMRLYWPKASVFDKSWQPVGVDKVE